MQTINARYRGMLRPRLRLILLPCLAGIFPAAVQPPILPRVAADEIFHLAGVPLRQVFQRAGAVAGRAWIEDRLESHLEEHGPFESATIADDHPRIVIERQ